MNWEDTFYQPTLEWKPFIRGVGVSITSYCYLLYWQYAIYFESLPSTVNLVYIYCLHLMPGIEEWHLCLKKKKDCWEITGKKCRQRFGTIQHHQSNTKAKPHLIKFPVLALFKRISCSLTPNIVESSVHGTKHS